MRFERLARFGVGFQFEQVGQMAEVIVGHEV